MGSLFIFFLQNFKFLAYSAHFQWEFYQKYLQSSTLRPPRKENLREDKRVLES